VFSLENNSNVTMITMFCLEDSANATMITLFCLEDSPNVTLITDLFEFSEISFHKYRPERLILNFYMMTYPVLSKTKLID
jgi:hypothetical protein